VDYFLRKLGGGTPRTIAASALAALEAYHWPGNVRELENIVRRATVVAKGPAILPSDLPPEFTAAPRAPAPAATTHAEEPSAPAAAPTSPASAAPPIPVPPAPQGSTPATMPELAQALFRHARSDPKLRILPAVERELIIQALRETSGNQVQAAKLLGITRATLRKRVEKFGIRRELSVA
jgi:two-component system nitrogen regulation response regulator GlnG